MTEQQTERLVIALEKINDSLKSIEMERFDTQGKLSQIATNIMNSASNTGMVNESYETQQNMREQRDYMREMKQFFQDMKRDRDTERWEKQDRETLEQQERLDKEIKITPYSEEQKSSLYLRRGISSKMKVVYKKTA